jgi:hypothetical protein
MQSETLLTKIILFSALLMLVTLTGCQLSRSSGTRKFAAPEKICSTSPASWQGISPGQTTKAEVITILGQPVEKNSLAKVDNEEVYVYSPIVNTAWGKYGNQIVFRQDGVVDWVDVWVSNSDDRFHTVAESVGQYGSTLDDTYIQGVLDTYGPSRVYVWSACGIAVTAIDASWLHLSPQEIPPTVEPMDNYHLTLMHPSPPLNPDDKPDVSQIVLRKFLFEPTDNLSFRELYADWIPYLSDKRFYRLKP